MKELKEDYERRLKTILIEIKNCPLNIEKETRLITKASCYRTIISGLKKALTTPIVSNQRELLLEEMDKYLMLNTSLDVRDLVEFKDRFKQ